MSLGPAAELLGVDKTFGGTTILKNFSLTFERQQTTALLGPSGSGKSTILRLLVGLVMPNCGEVRVLGETLKPANLRSIRQRLGYMTQDGGLFPHLTARENVTLLASHLGREPQWQRSRIEELAQMVRLTSDMLDRYPAELSGGQRQRVALMRALMLDPELLLLDEPLGALDPITRSQTQKELRELFATLGKAVILVTHDLPEATSLAGRVVLLKPGGIAQDGTPAELLARPADEFVARFLATWLQLGGG